VRVRREFESRLLAQMRFYRSMQGEARDPLRRRHSEREEETRDRAERGSAVRGSDQANVAP